MRRMTTDEFVERAKQVHGEKYDYSETVYISNKQPVTIICPEHGPFQQRPINHLSGKGCPYCAGNARMTTRTFIDKARAVHGDKYGYRLAEYTGYHKKVSIICPVHGKFEQTPCDHLHGHGCPSCAVKHVETTSKNNTQSDPHRVLRRTERPRFTGTPYSCSQVAKWYQFDVIYGRELDLWERNDDYRGRPLHEWLYENRYRYIGKTPEQLNDKEILRGLTIAGVLRGYTTFDAMLMRQVIEKYQVKSVYDPCAGWGERMLTCANMGIEYRGVDINGQLLPGYRQMMSDLNLRNCVFSVGDSSDMPVMGPVDAVITCPPYSDLERYSDKGAENFSHEEFLDWWLTECDIARNLNARILAFQINTGLRDELVGIAESCGFCMIDELWFRTNKSSHFTRKHGENRKKSCESMIVLARSEKVQ